MKTTLQHYLRQAVQQLCDTGKLPAQAKEAPIQVERARDPKFGDYASNIAMILAKSCQQNPKLIAEELVSALDTISNVHTVSVAAPGFINFGVEDAFFHSKMAEIIAQKEAYGQIDYGRGEKVHIEIVSANPTGPLHVGHGRLAAYSASLANVLAAAGFKVHREYYVNDAGRQMRILATSVWLRYLEIMGEGVPFPGRGYKGSYIIDIARTLQEDYGDQFFQSAAMVFADVPPDDEAHEEAHIDALIERAEMLLDKSNFKLVFDRAMNSILDDIREDLSEFGVICEEWFLESKLLETGDIDEGIERLKKGDYLYEKDNAMWFRSTTFGDEKDRVVVRENGQPTYFASDIGYHLNKLERGFDHLVDVYGADHHGYIARLNGLLQALGDDPKKLNVLLVQFAILYRGKTKVSMSTRGGEFVTLRELREEVGNDAARFFYIMRKREQHLDFDLELAKSESNDNPVYYIQYAHARVCSIFRQLAQKNMAWDQAQGEASLALLIHPHEKALSRQLARFPECIEMAAVANEPAVVATYLHELANGFHSYYNAHVFLVEEEEVRNARLYLVEATRQVLRNGLTLLGLSVPEVM
ncbi:MAG: arginyl-tRNA synthetase [Gammaproteobacteria bacterium]|jgi:arginyl-tRNA synthetase|nr:arginyl-tRNA synthetase [Gammaproteobacteria bacterium]